VGVVAEEVPHGEVSPSPVRILSLLRDPLTKIANVGPLEFGAALPRPTAPTVTPQHVSTPSTPAAEPRPPMIAPVAEDAIPSVAQWTPDDITKHPEFDPPARPTSGPTKLTGRFKGFASKAQWRFAFATHKPWAHRRAEASKGGPKVRYRVLPERKGPPDAGSIK
jgi:hypothetical protein